MTLLPSLIKDINKLKATFMSMNVIQSNISITDIQDIGDESNMFELIDSLELFQNDIDVAIIE